MQANAFEQISAYEAISFHLCELFHGGLIYFFRFHTYDYARHFVSACTRILGLEGTPEGVEDQGRLTRVAAFPIGIDSDRFKRALELPAVKRHINELTHRFAGRKVWKHPSFTCNKTNL
jgi:trehalose-6-phosphate synthase